MRNKMIRYILILATLFTFSCEEGQNLGNDSLNDNHSDDRIDYYIDDFMEDTSMVPESLIRTKDLEDVERNNKNSEMDEISSESIN